MRTLVGDAECDVCGAYAVVSLRNRFLCGVCFGVSSLLIRHRSFPGPDDAVELFSCVYRDERSAEEISALLRFVYAQRVAAQPAQ